MIRDINKKTASSAAQEKRFNEDIIQPKRAFRDITLIVSEDWINQHAPLNDLSDPENLILALEKKDSRIDVMEDAILLASGTAFSESQRPRLLRALEAFISSHLYTQDPTQATIVGAAVRKYGLNIDEPQFEAFAQWLKPHQTKYLDPWVELELVKAISWRLSFEPVLQKGEFPHLHQALFDISTGYLNQRLLLQENFAAISLNAIVAVSLLDAICGSGEFTTTLYQQVIRTELQWFVELLDDRMNETIEYVRDHDELMANELSLLFRQAGGHEQDM